ncbi:MULTISPECIES: lipoate--protein ligase family protein [Exiguobacterium]|uniref:Octanoyltransferase LipM n=1 Tax=Exiguobacterium antarcticum TaxID=132920 RepID=A0ABT6R1J0_9BACL|nr:MULTISPECIES: lipoate--protein ligase family protein [Exiguobacterium]AFS70006.1 Octanoyltransferase LipM [Exiguobacterium antarcticum B7]MCT4780072.1 lipoate--protein ligase family protein [Exiguobacterium soli]MDI3234134.1 lipoate--protein ligase family protein [Exiguobacterium antarcticum]
MIREWQVLTTERLEPALNMAIDEALIGFVGRGEVAPTLRFYSWEPRGLSVGHFQRAVKDIDRERIEQLGIPIVRRMTGGRAVLHADELTYSIVIPETSEGLPKTVIESYRMLTEGVRKGYHHLGIPVEFSVPMTEQEKEELRKPKSAVCFDAASYYELAVGKRKVAGSAQVRHQGVVLQHGSVPLSVDEGELFDCFVYEDETIRERMKARFAGKAVALNELAGRTVSFEEVRVAFLKGFEEALQLTFTPLEFTEHQWQEIERLAAKYRSEEWNWKR